MQCRAENASPGVLEACGNSGDSAEDKEDEALLLLGCKLLGLILAPQAVKRLHLYDRKRIHERQTCTDNRAEDAAVLERLILVEDGKDPLLRERKLVHDHLGELGPVAEAHVHPGDALVGLGKRHLDVVDEGLEERPLRIGMAESIEVPEGLAGASQAVPGSEVDACLAPAEDPGIVRRSSKDFAPRPRLAGREPIGRRPISASGVTQLNHSAKPSWFRSLR